MWKKYCIKKGLLFQERENLITDYAFANIGIEAKSIPDFMSSMYSGHLDRQLQNLDDNYNQVILIVWGTIDSYISKARRGGKKLSFPKVFAGYTGGLARYRRIDILRAAGCSEIIAKRLLENFGSISEITSLSPAELQSIDGLGKIRTQRILHCLNSEDAVPDEKVKMTRA